MIGHQHPADEQEFHLLPQPLERLDKAAAKTLGEEKGREPIGARRQLVQMIQVVIVLLPGHASSLVPFTHGRINERQCVRHPRVGLPGDLRVSLLHRTPTALDHLSRKPSKPVSVRFDNDEPLYQLVFGISIQDPLEFAVNCVLSGGEYAKIQDPSPERLDEDEAAEIPVARYEQPALFLGCSEQVFVVCLCESDLSHGNYVVS